MIPSHVGIRVSLPVASPNRTVIPAYNTPLGPRVQLMTAVDTARLPHVPVHSGQTSGLAERVCDKQLYNAGNTSDLQASKMASVHAHMWQQNRQFSAQSVNCRLQPQPMPAYMTQQQRMQAPVSGCGTVPDWSSRFSGQTPYLQPERLPRHHQQQQQQRLVMPSGTMIRQQLPTYQNVVDHHVHQDMVKHTWQQQQQRHLMNLQSMSQHHRYVVSSVASESLCDVGFRPAASSNCVMTSSSSLAVSSTGTV